MGLTDRPLVFLPAPPTCALSRLHFGMKVHRALGLEGRNLEEGEVLLPSPHRYLQGSCPFSVAL